MPNTIIDPTLTDHTVAVYAAIRQAHNDFGESPSYIELQHACHISAPTVRKAISALKKAGHVLAPKFQVRAIRPVDPDRVVLNKEPNPWDSLVPPKKYFRST